MRKMKVFKVFNREVSKTYSLLLKLLYTNLNSIHPHDSKYPLFNCLTYSHKLELLSSLSYCLISRKDPEYDLYNILSFYYIIDFLEVKIKKEIKRHDEIVRSVVDKEIGDLEKENGRLRKKIEKLKEGEREKLLEKMFEVKKRENGIRKFLIKRKMNNQCDQINELTFSKRYVVHPIIEKDKYKYCLFRFISFDIFLHTKQGDILFKSKRVNQSLIFNNDLKLWLIILKFIKNHFCVLDIKEYESIMDFIHKKEHDDLSRILNRQYLKRFNMEVFKESKKRIILLSNLEEYHGSIDKLLKRSVSNDKMNDHLPDPPSYDKLLSCIVCKKENENMNRCIRCKIVHYCSRKCQKKHWKLHKPNCNNIHSFLNNFSTNVII